MEKKKPDFSIRLEVQRARDLPRLLERAKRYSDGKYTYEDFANNFRGTRAIYKFVCNKHGEFEASGDAFINPGRRRNILCPTCAKEASENSKKKVLEERMKRKAENREKLRQLKASMPASLKQPIKTREDFANRGKWIYGDQYSYDYVEYVNLQTPVILVCKDHGTFKTIPHTFFKGYSGCVDCGMKKRHENHRLGYDDLCMKLFQRYGEQYRVIQETFVNMDVKCVFICKDHGTILKEPKQFLRYPCEKCFVERNTLTFEEFAARGTEIHNGKFRYVKDSYINTRTPITIICPIHGAFNQVPNEHIKHRFITGPNGLIMVKKGNGCRLCRESNGERLVANALDKIGVKYCREARCGNTLMHFDFLITGNPNLVIEYDGEQHYRDVWSQIDFEKLRARDKFKDDFCKEKGWIMRRIPYSLPISKLQSVVNAICYLANLPRTCFISLEDYEKYVANRSVFMIQYELRKKEKEKSKESQTEQP